MLSKLRCIHHFKSGFNYNAKSRKYRAAFKAKSREKTWQVWYNWSISNSEKGGRNQVSLLTYVTLLTIYAHLEH